MCVDTMLMRSVLIWEVLSMKKESNKVCFIIEFTDFFFLKYKN